jgi:hypothetical protein
MNQDLMIKFNENKTRFAFHTNARLVIVWKLSSTRTEPNPVTKVFKNGNNQIQKIIVSERMNIFAKSFYYRKPQVDYHLEDEIPTLTKNQEVDISQDLEMCS